MIDIKPQFITDKAGNKISVVLPLKDFEAIMEALEDIEDVRLYDEAKKSNEPSIPVDVDFK